MIFFINAQMPEQKSGIEHAELKRLELFNKMKVDCRLILRDWSADTHRLTQAVGIDDQQLINMFDYYQQALQVQRHIVHPDDLDFGVADVELQYEPENQRYLVVTPAQELVARINVAGDEERVVST
ncbi:glycosyl transferase family 1, partial [Pediococcus acidilactici]|nr:glycosyl transferase family 1 [Pediococcus acidilactici]